MQWQLPEQKSYSWKLFASIDQRFAETIFLSLLICNLTHREYLRAIENWVCYIFTILVWHWSCFREWEWFTTWVITFISNALLVKNIHWQVSSRGTGGILWLRVNRQQMNLQKSVLGFVVFPATVNVTYMYISKPNSWFCHSHNLQYSATIHMLIMAKILKHGRNKNNLEIWKSYNFQGW